MGKPNPAGLQVVVAGDMPIDWNYARTAGPDGAGVRTSCAPGGAARLGELLTTIAGGVTARTGRPIEVHAPIAPDAVSPVDGRFHHCHAVWARFPAGDRPAWRIERVLGVDRAAGAVDGGARSRPAKADLIVLHDADLGFRDQPELWPRALDHLDEGEPWIVLRTVGPVARGALWQRLQPHAERLIVVMGIADLRLEDVRISRELSWERTAQDLVWELLYNPRVSGLRQCAQLIVSFTTAGALVASTASTTTAAARESDCVLVFDPAAMERMWNEPYQGDMIGGISTLTAGIAGNLLDQLAGQPGSVVDGVRRGIAAMRALDRAGYAEITDQHGQSRLAFPTEHLVRQLSAADGELAEARVADPLRARGTAAASADGGDWTILADRYPGERLETLAYRIVREGADRVLADVPRAQYADLVTFDRHEIESLQSVRTLIRRYYRRPDPGPLSIAVFGPPGAGKSWSVKQVANSVARGAPAQTNFTGIADISFNLSQFEDPRELIAALHQVRDIRLGGKLPLVFWDEFDATRTVGGRQPLGWLAHFLAPMQDGIFTDGQLIHHIGPAVFVFAGGLFSTMAEFEAESIGHRDLKAPDFVSRLSGYVNILGPNPTGDDARFDPYYLVRRAVLLRSLLLRTAPEIFHQRDGVAVPKIDSGVLRALLLTSKYRHGARSVKSIIGMSTLAGSDRLERSDLASEAQLALHVDPNNFLELVHLADINPELQERLAEAVHVLYCASQLAAGASWTGDDKYLHTSPLLLPYAGRQPAAPGTDPWLVGYEALPPERKSEIARQVAELPNRLAAAGYLTHPLGARPPLSDLVDLRCTLEAAAVTAAATKPDAGQLAQADQALADLRRPGVSAEDFHDADVRFHVALAGASRSEPLHLLMLAVRGAMAGYLIERLRRSADLPATLSRLTAEHAAIRQAIDRHDGALASELVRAHVLDFYRAVTSDRT